MIAGTGVLRTDRLTVVMVILLMLGLAPRGWSLDGRASEPFGGTQRAAVVSSAQDESVVFSRAGGTWVLAYYPTWAQKKGELSPAGIDYTAMTHVVQFALEPLSNGELDFSANGGLTWNMANALIKEAHAHACSVIIGIGGWNHDRFAAAISPANRTKFIQNIVKLCTTWKYDGVDIDMEPIRPADSDAYTTFIRSLHGALNEANPDLTLTVATQWMPSMFAKIYNDIDRINLMTYDLAGKWPGFVSWHNTALHNGGLKFPGGKVLPSASQMAQEFLAAGVPKTKLGIGIDFAGYVWEGVNAPNQGLETVTKVTTVKYREIMDNYYTSQRYRWHDAAHAPYLSIDVAGTQNDRFITYDDERSCTEKVRYVKSQGLGGLIVWDISAGFRRSQPEGSRDLLLRSVRKAMFGR